MIEISDYVSEVRGRLAELLNAQRAATKRDEQKVQDFFENYPTALLTSIDDVEANYSIYGGLVVSQPRFKSYEGDRQPDFLIVTSNSLNLYFNFIELEDPSKKIFSTTGLKPCAHFLEAYNQLRQWNSYSENEVENYCRFLLNTLFKDNYDSRTHKQHHYNYVLVYGFSDEVTDSSSRHNHLLQDYFKEKNFHHCTYSRMMNNVAYRGKLISVKKDGAGKFRAISMTPFKRYENDEWSDYHNVNGKDEAVRRSKYLTEPEQDELIRKMQAVDKKTYKQVTDEQLKGMGMDFSDLTDFEI